MFEADYNPFSDEYMEQEVEFYGLSEFELDGVKIVSTEIKGRCDDYLNINFRTGSKPCPILFVDGTLWMSLSFMEVQSCYLPTKLAHGRVATAGLGLGYFVLKAAALSTVDSIHVYERDARLITFFQAHFSHREGFDKIRFIHGDVRELLKGKKYDFVFMDIYPVLLGDEVLTDARLFVENNEIGHYCFWGMEAMVLEALLNDLLEEWAIPYPITHFFRLWMTDRQKARLHQQRCDSEFLANGVEILQNLGLLQQGELYDIYRGVTS